MSPRSGPITQDEGVQIDELFRNRWRTLLSVDDAIAGVHATIEDLGLLNSTYFIITCATSAFCIVHITLCCDRPATNPFGVVHCVNLQVRSRVQSW